MWDELPGLSAFLTVYIPPPTRPEIWVQRVVGLGQLTWHPYDTNYYLKRFTKRNSMDQGYFDSFFSLSNKTTQFWILWFPALSVGNQQLKKVAANIPTHRTCIWTQKQLGLWIHFDFVPWGFWKLASKKNNALIFVPILTELTYLKNLRTCQ